MTSDALSWQALLSAWHLTDANLLVLAVHNGGRFVTRDCGVPPAAAGGAAAASLAVLD